VASKFVPADGATRVGPERGERILVWAGFPAAGAMLGGLLWWLSDWLSSLRWRPVRKLFKLLDFLSDPLGLFGLALVGVVLGVLVALMAEGEYVTVAVEDDQVVCTRDGDSRTVPRTAVSGVFVDDGRLAAAFLKHGYPWLPEGDPHRDEYRRWVPDASDLPPGADAFLTARDRALKSNDKEEVTQLREELGRLGVVVRDDKKKRQFWRHAGKPLDRRDQ
jgi:hypothetical protein